jgi:hypothetical protein
LEGSTVHAVTGQRRYGARIYRVCLREKGVIVIEQTRQRLDNSGATAAKIGASAAAVHHTRYQLA